MFAVFLNKTHTNTHMGDVTVVLLNVNNLTVGNLVPNNTIVVCLAYGM